MNNKVNELFETWLLEEHNDTIHTKEDLNLAVQDEEYQKLFLKFIGANL
jgi:hypothetical protein